MKKSSVLFVLIIILAVTLLGSCQKAVDSYASDIIALKASVTALQKRSDSLASALAITNNNLGALSKTVDSIKLQLSVIIIQINQLNIQLTTVNANIVLINAQIVILNQQYADLLAKLNAILAQLAITPNSLNSGLVAYYPFNGNAGDSSGNGNHGTVFGATLSADRFGKPNSAYSFNGNSNYINTAQSSSLSISGEITMVAWVYDYGALGSYHTILNKRLVGNWSYGIAYSFTYGPGGSPTEVNKIFSGRRVNNSSWQVGYRYSNDPISFNKWQCIIVTIQNDIVTFYIDGKNAGYNIYGNTYSIPMVDQPVGLTIGNNASAGEWMYGIIDDIRIYNRVLNTNEITYLATH